MSHGQLPVDEYHAISLHLTTRIREGFAALHERVARWEPAPYPDPPSHPQRTVVTGWPIRGEDGDALYQRTPYLDEVERPRRWLR